MSQNGGDADATKRIKQMINFIKQEAQEKAEEIRVKAEEEFQIEKGRILNPERLKLNQEFEKKFKDLEIQRKIEFSTQINKARLEVLEKRGKFMQEIQQAAFQRLGDVKKDTKKYEELLRKLIIQGLIRIDEVQVRIQCLKEDLSALQNAVGKAIEEYKKIWKAQVGEDTHVDVTVETDKFLPASYVGGIVITARQNKIVLDNTLAARLEICQDALLPIIRGRLFGVVEHIGVIYTDSKEEHKQNH